MAWHQQVLGVCRLQKCEIEEANTLVWIRKHFSKDMCMCVYIYIGYRYIHVIKSYWRYNWPMCATHRPFLASDIPPLMIEHHAPNQTKMFPFKLIFQGWSQVPFAWMECIFNSWLEPTIANEEPSLKDVHPTTPVWQSTVIYGIS